MKSLSPQITAKIRPKRRSFDSLGKLDNNKINFMIDKAKIEEQMKYEKKIENLENSFSQKILRQENEIEELSERLRKYEAFTRYYPQDNEMIFEEDVENSPFLKTNSPMIINNLKNNGKKISLSLSAKPKKLFKQEEDPCSPKDTLKEGISPEIKTTSVLRDTNYSGFICDLAFSEESNGEIIRLIRKTLGFLNNVKEEIKIEIFESLRFSLEMLNSKFKLYSANAQFLFKSQNNVIVQLKKENEILEKEKNYLCKKPKEFDILSDEEEKPRKDKPYFETNFKKFYDFLSEKPERVAINLEKNGNKTMPLENISNSVNVYNSKSHINNIVKKKLIPLNRI